MGTRGVPDTWQVSWVHGGPGAGTWGGSCAQRELPGPHGLQPWWRPTEGSLDPGSAVKASLPASGRGGILDIFE